MAKDKTLPEKSFMGMPVGSSLDVATELGLQVWGNSVSKFSNNLLVDVFLGLYVPV
jgi:hypothetical protein